ncbi:hypothetical protein, partial [Acinetobacter nosocomialis]|uniref:hypothetical protein n=1 Tax=Acinetobacter nosocomialis TaxID=106654 RepID=UPI003CC8CB54
GITIKDFFKTYYDIEKFTFSDQTITMDYFRQNGLTFDGTDAGETITTWSYKSIVKAGAGDDIVTASGYDDVLDGGSMAFREDIGITLCATFKIVITRATNQDICTSSTIQFVITTGSSR